MSVLNNMLKFFSKRKQTTDERTPLSEKEREELAADIRVPLIERVTRCMLPCCFRCKDMNLCNPEEGDGEHHKSTSGTAGWLRAAVLGANDSLVSVAALMVRSVSPLRKEDLCAPDFQKSGLTSAPIFFSSSSRNRLVWPRTETPHKGRCSWRVWRAW